MPNAVMWKNQEKISEILERCTWLWGSSSGCHLNVLGRLPKEGWIDLLPSNPGAGKVALKHRFLS
jgi:hypothetical protein